MLRIPQEVKLVTKPGGRFGDDFVGSRVVIELVLGIVKVHFGDTRHAHDFLVELVWVAGDGEQTEPGPAVFRVERSTGRFNILVKHGINHLLGCVRVGACRCCSGKRDGVVVPGGGRIEIGGGRVGLVADCLPEERETVGVDRSVRLRCWVRFRSVRSLDGLDVVGGRNEALVEIAHNVGVLKGHVKYLRATVVECRNRYLLQPHQCCRVARVGWMRCLEHCAFLSS